MDTIEAKVQSQDDSHILIIELEDSNVEIPITEDNPKKIMSAFNQIIEAIRNKDLQIQLTDPGPDLFSQVAKEYISQLNGEIQEVREEMIRLGLANT